MKLIYIYESKHMVKSCINLFLYVLMYGGSQIQFVFIKNIAKCGHNYCLLFFTKIGICYNSYCTNKCCTRTFSCIIFGKVTLLVSIEPVTLSMYVGLVHVCCHY